MSNTIPTPDNRGSLPAGTEIPEGTILSRTLTAYVVEGADGSERFVPFGKVHPARFAEPLITFGGAR